jgi:enamine deaminase RidA (YjgF/YER057c/UK114 family)
MLAFWSVSKQVVFTQDYTSLGMPGTTGPAVACYRAGNYVYITGQTAFTLDGKLVGVGDPATQARQAMENIAALMQMAGGSVSDVLKITVYLTDANDGAGAYSVIRSYFPEVLPCDAGFIVKGLAREDLLVEIDAWGFIDDDRTRRQLIQAREVTGLAAEGCAGIAAQCYRAGNLVYMQCQDGRAPSGELVGAGDPAVQARQAMDNIAALMENAGGSVSDVVRTIYSVTEREYRGTAYPVIRKYFNDTVPTGTGLVLKGLATSEALVAIDTWGWIDSPEAPKKVVRSMSMAPARMLGNDVGRAIQCTRAGNWVFIQGQVGWTLDGEVVEADPAAQTRQAMENISALMELAGGKLSDVLRIVVYVTDRRIRRLAYPVIRSYVGELWPCGSGIVVKGLARPDLVVEIDAYGFIDDPDGASLRQNR